MKILTEEEFMKLSPEEQKKLADESEQLVRRLKKNRAQRRAEAKLKRKQRKVKSV